MLLLFVVDFVIVVVQSWRFLLLFVCVVGVVLLRVCCLLFVGVVCALLCFGLKCLLLLVVG